MGRGDWAWKTVDNKRPAVGTCPEGGGGREKKHEYRITMKPEARNQCSSIVESYRSCPPKAGRKTGRKRKAWVKAPAEGKKGVSTLPYLVKRSCFAARHRRRGG